MTDYSPAILSRGRSASLGEGLGVRGQGQSRGGFREFRKARDRLSEAERLIQALPDAEDRESHAPAGNHETLEGQAYVA
jgi:hypothetical protein